MLSAHILTRLAASTSRRTCTQRFLPRAAPLLLPLLFALTVPVRNHSAAATPIVDDVCGTSSSSSTSCPGMSTSSSSSDVVSVSTHGPGAWQTRDPFIFCVHHLDRYPAGNDKMGPAASLAGRNIGQDFSGKDGWSMYHGEDGIAGFPGHPHRGFETVTIVRQGLIDHSDSLGATARFGRGDVQWVTAGAGIVHAEMFPLVHRDGPNTLELFQLWLNLPRKNKMAAPYFTMLWDENIPRQQHKNDAGKQAVVSVIAGELDGLKPLPPPPHSWAADSQSDLAIWPISLEEGASWTLPPARFADTVRTLHVFQGPGLLVAGRDVQREGKAVAVELRPQASVKLEAHRGPVEILLLQARPLNEPVAQRGPFVMSTQAELAQAFDDYRRTQFGGWPWDDNAPVHPREQPRFAKHADGRVDKP